MAGKRLNNKTLGEAVNLSHVTIGNYVAGQFPKSEHAVALARVLGTTTDFLLTGVMNVTSDEAVREEAPPYRTNQVTSALEQIAAIEAQLSVLRRTVETLRK